MSNVELLASYWTLAHGAEPHTDHEYSTILFEDRVAAAARAGFTGIGIWHADLVRTLTRIGPSTMKRVLDDHGIRHVELEFLNDWFMTGERRRRSDATRRLLFEASAVFGARHIKVGDFDRERCPMSLLVDAFGTLCQEAAVFGARVAFEFMPFATIDTLEEAISLVNQAGAKNGGLIVDLWHVVKLGIHYEYVAGIPTEMLFGIEINDGYLQTPRGMTLREETTQHRKLCGEGEFDIKGFVATMRRAGYQGPWGIEVLSRVLRGKPLEEVAQAAFETTHAQFSS